MKNKSNSRITVFLGAGAVTEIGGPKTETLSSAVKQREQWDEKANDQSTIPAIKHIADALDKYYDTKKSKYSDTERTNFEDIFHAIESLVSLQGGQQPETGKPFKPAIGAFVEILKAHKYNSLVLSQALNDIIDEVAKHIVKYMEGFRPNEKHQWFSDFWRKVAKKGPLDIAALNYDDCIERSLIPGSWEDGFEKSDSELYLRFNPAAVIDTSKTRILHLHGSVLYGYPVFDNSNQYIFSDQHEDLYRFVTNDEAKRTWFNRSQNYAQSGEKAIAGPIITGQRKPDKLLAYPYSTYQSILQTAILYNPRLLIIGYSFGDVHFNRVLSRLTRHHGNDRRVVLIDYLPERCRGEYWIADPSIIDWPNNQMFQIVARLAGEINPLHKGPYSNPWVSQDDKCRIYLDGFKGAIEQHSDEIIEFLMS